MSDSDGPPDDSTADWADGRTTFQRVYDVLVGTTDSASAGQFAEWAECSENGARAALEQLVEMGIATRTDSRPATYRRNPSYFRWKRIERLADDHDASELRARLEELLADDRALQEKYDVPDPDAVPVDETAVADHEKLHERWDDLSEWRTIRRDITVLQRAVQRAESRNGDRARV
ncbi:DUF7342 family protein [Halopiger xanaduensis]|uniref:Uncharacterized protein n=1 Tax=Halopiger xanaduensis (strain DSM 18323 / JCM 14033 / SH-6) TaxID=797210 RepID=F8DC03_HALXS|nr:hypothetical protein [Halopiger xanaduensis]AEH35980.1 hypothetical protein Halxa_1347 [Halopiger xanaduensis SH-6]